MNVKIKLMFGRFVFICSILFAVMSCGATDIDTPENTRDRCQDNYDNDYDGKIDCRDEDCADFAFCADLNSDAGVDGDTGTDGDAES